MNDEQVAGLAIFGKKFFQSLHGLRKILPAKTQSKVIIGFIVHRTWQKQNTCLTDKFIAEVFDLTFE